MTHVNSSHIHHNAKLTLFSFGFLQFELIMVLSQTVPMDKQENRNRDRVEAEDFQSFASCASDGEDTFLL